MKLLISVRDEHEALAAAEAGADLIDMKEPQAGALGALPFDVVRHIVARLRTRHPGLRLSATVGDPAPGDAVVERVIGMAACGVDDVKVGLVAGAEGEARLDDLAALAASGRCGHAQIVPVLVADDGVPARLVTCACAGPFAAVMLDTLDKSRGSLVALRAEPELRAFVDAVRASGKLAGLAGSLRIEDAAALMRAAPDFAGFRGAVCAGDRRGVLDPGRVGLLRRGMVLTA